MAVLEVKLLVDLTFDAFQLWSLLHELQDENILSTYAGPSIGLGGVRCGSIEVGRGAEMAADVESAVVIKS